VPLFSHFAVTATELKTSSTLITPTPTWTVTTVTISQPATATPPPVVSPPQPVLPSVWPQAPQPRRFVNPLTGLEHADVLEVNRDTSPVDAKEQLDRLRQAYNVFLTNSRARAAAANARGRPRNPLFDDDDVDDYLDSGLDQQVLAAQARPVFVKRPEIKATPVVRPSKEEEEEGPAVESSVEVVTLYVSGRRPGEYTTRLSTVTKGIKRTATPKRYRREAYSLEPAEEMELLPLATSALMAENGVHPSATVTVTVTQCPHPVPSH